MGDSVKQRRTRLEGIESHFDARRLMSGAMAENRATKSGLAAEMQSKVNAKYSEDFDCAGTMDNFQEQLKDGQKLCKLMNALKPGTIKKVNAGKHVFKWMENLENFNQACKAFRVPEMETFQAVDLTGRVNLHQVVLCCNGLARKANSVGLRGFGPKESEQNKRDFSEETLKAGQSVIGLQMGSNQGATQSGQNFGNYRHM